MIIVWGSVEARGNCREEVLRLSYEHVRRSRKEPGCVSHSVQIDADNKNRLIFFEEWETMPALQTHFQVPESAAFVAAVGKLAIGPPEMKLYEATQLR
jgi:quinol monooxygenase YgiN